MSTKAQKETLACDTRGTFYARTRELLKADPRTLPEIYVATGIPFYWLREFSKGVFENPSVNRVQYLYEFLTGDKLDLK